MNYIKQLQADKAEALDSARSIETEITISSHIYAATSFDSIHAYKSATCSQRYYPTEIP
jgi:hypothetical protein